MANLSEMSVAISLRDWQWRNKIIDSDKMELFVPLTGRSDQLLGDLFIEPNDRLLLLEVKSLRTEISSEWRKKKIRNVDDDGKEAVVKKAKNAYEFMRRALLSDRPRGVPAESQQLRAFARTSLAGHHFLYWDPQIPQQRTKNGIRGSLMMEPYCLAIAKQKGFGTSLGVYTNEGSSDLAIIERAADFLISKFSLGIRTADHFQGSHHSIDYYDTYPFEVGMIYSDSARLIETRRGSGASDTFWFYIGLELAEFKTYVESVCSGHDPEIRVVVSSISGDVFAYADNVSDLMRLLKKIKMREKPEATPTGAHLAKSGYEMTGSPAPPLAMSKTFKK